MKSKKEQANDSFERIIQAATKLFAEHGYHGVSTREIAAAVDLNIATVNYHVGSKQNLYHLVFQRAFQKEEALIAGFVEDVDDATLADPNALRDQIELMINALIQLSVNYPEIPRLYVRRWLEKDSNLLENYEAKFSIPLYELSTRLLQRAHNMGTIDLTDLNMELFQRSFTWMLHGYFVSGITQSDPNDPAQLEAFKHFLVDYLCKMLHLPIKKGVQKTS